MVTEGEKKAEGKRYKITLMRFGKAIVTAKSREEAAEQAISLEETEIEWLSEKDGILGGRLVSLIELMEDKM